MQPVTIEELKKVIALSELPEEHLQWILDHSESVEYDDGELVGKTGDLLNGCSSLSRAELTFIWM